MAAFKDNLDAAAARRLGEAVRAAHPAFEVDAFVARATEGLDALELKARVARFAEALRPGLPDDVTEALAVLTRALPPERAPEDSDGEHPWHLWPVEHFIGFYGLDHFDAAMAALNAITRRTTAEFGIRPFLLRYPERTLAVLADWTRSDSAHVRRLASEGTRPRLPWGIRLTPFVRDPSPTLPLLEALKDDPSEYVRRSVANHLNDVAKDHPDRVLTLAARWLQDAPEPRQRLIRHALRTLVKAGDPGALRLVGFTGAEDLGLTDLTVPAEVPWGGAVTFSFTVHNHGDRAHRVAVDYRLHMQGARGPGRVKVFKLAERTLGPGEAAPLAHTRDLRSVTVRRYYPGLHRIEVQVNGVVMGGVAFVLSGLEGGGGEVAQGGV
ncbi:MAG: DNA alkylation repair protein [Alphaproteobacteria bacterium]|nr:DNA alkylation repair protein [Alphaproteobacteria bacterium]